MSSEDFENMTCLFGQHLTNKVQTLHRTHGNSTEILWHCSLLHLLQATRQAISLVTPQVSEALQVANTSPQFVKPKARQIYFDPDRLGRVAEEIIRGQIGTLQKHFLQGA